MLVSLLTVYLAWGSTSLAIRIALTSLPPFLLAGLRGLVAGALLLNLEGELQASPAGAIALIGATMSWAVGSVMTRRMLLPEGAALVAIELLSGGLLMTVFGLLIGERVVSSAWPS